MEPKDTPGRLKLVGKGRKQKGAKAVTSDEPEKPKDPLAEVIRLARFPDQVTGRSHVEFNLEIVKRLARIGCTDKEIAAFFGVSPKTIQRRKQEDEAFADAMEIGLLQGNIKLRQLQMTAAEEGNPALLIFLGKNRLGQSDQVNSVVDLTVTPKFVIGVPEDAV